jgi:hypothetical protein
MRAAVLAILTLATFTTAQGEPTTPRGIVFAQECKQVDAKATGFSCQLNEDGMQILWHEKTSAMPPQRKERAEYEFSRVALRYVELGGRHFTVRFAHWPADKVRNCWRRKNKPYADYYCIDG